MLNHATIKIGDRARFPIGRLGDDETYRHSFIVVAFEPSGLVVLRRLADGLERRVSAMWVDRYTLETDYRPKRQTTRPRLALPALNTDRTLPGFYVSVRHAGKQRHILAAGPFSYPGDARRLVSLVNHKVSTEYGGSRDWWDLSFGVCRMDDGQAEGKWNAELLGVSA